MPNKDDFPKQIKLCSIVIDVEVVQEIQHNPEQIGEFIGSVPKIILVNTLSYEMMRHTLWHELIHAIEYFYSAFAFDRQKSKTGNEAYIDTISFGVVNLLADNPQLREMFEETKCED